jgi:hypothetical protein
MQASALGMPLFDVYAAHPAESQVHDERVSKAIH